MKLSDKEYSLLQLTMLRPNKGGIVFKIRQKKESVTYTTNIKPLKQYYHLTLSNH